MAKYNQLLRIEGELGGKVRYAGKDAFPREDLSESREEPMATPVSTREPARCWEP